MNNKIPPGPEDIPTLGYIKSFRMKVDIKDNSGKVIRTQEIDYGNHEQRKWLGRVTFWACSNGMSVTTSGI